MGDELVDITFSLASLRSNIGHRLARIQTSTDASSSGSTIFESVHADTSVGLSQWSKWNSRHYMWLYVNGAPGSRRQIGRTYCGRCIPVGGSSHRGCASRIERRVELCRGEMRGQRNEIGGLSDDSQN